MLYFYGMESTISYNEYLYRKRMEMGLSKKKFAKFLHIPTLFYSYYENGYVKPSKKYVNLISEALGVDYSVYLEGMSSYPTNLPESPTRFERFYKKFLGKLYAKIIFIVLLVGSITVCAVGFGRYSYIMNHADTYFNERYNNFVDTMREKGGSTFSLLHELVRPEIHMTEGDAFVSISTSSQTYATRSLSAYIDYSNTDGNLYYIVPNSARTSLYQIDIEYIDGSSLSKYHGTLYRDTLDDKFQLAFNIYGDVNVDIEMNDLYKNLMTKFGSHIDDINRLFTSLIKDKLGLDYDFYGELLIDHEAGATKNLYGEITSLSMGVGGIILIGGCLFFLLFAIFFGESRKKKELSEKQEEKIMEENTPIRTLKVPKKDIRFFPFIPETVFEIIGIFLVFMGSVRIIYYAVNLFSNTSVNQSTFDSTTISLFMYFTIGMFLLYFIDFDIFLNDKRSLRNFFLYGLVFFGLYFIEVILLDYLTKTRGIIQIVDYLYVIPNNFGSIACYFGIMVFLFYNPKWANTKKKLISFRCLSIIPIIWVFTCSLIFQNYKTWKLDFNNWQLYFFDSERPQFTLLCILYLVGLYFLRLYFKRKYGAENAIKFFNGNKFYWLKNILICVIIAVLAVTEYLLKNTGRNNKSMGGYWQIVYLIPMLLFYHPHFGKRCKPVDYITLTLYGLMFGCGYVIGGLLVIIYIFR